MQSATVFFALAAVVAAVSAGAVDIHARPHYHFSYGVSDKHTHDIKSASESRDGDVTKGHYSLVQPDGVVRTVKYIVTPHGGFNAQVINHGWSTHPVHHHSHHGHGHGHAHAHQHISHHGHHNEHHHQGPHHDGHKHQEGHGKHQQHGHHESHHHHQHHHDNHHHDVFLGHGLGLHHGASSVVYWG